MKFVLGNHGSRAGLCFAMTSSARFCLTVLVWRSVAAHEFDARPHSQMHGRINAYRIRLSWQLLCRFSDAGNRGSIDTRGRPASEKRQGRKSRLVVQRRCGVRYGDLAAGLGLKGLGRSGCRGRLAANPGRADRGERSVGTLPDGICDADAGQSGGRMQVWSRPAARQRGWQGS